VVAIEQRRCVLWRRPNDDNTERREVDKRVRCAVMVKVDRQAKPLTEIESDHLAVVLFLTAKPDTM